MLGPSTIRGSWSTTGRISLLLALFHVSPSFGAERYSISIEHVPGLPGAISDVAQDGDGFLWVSSAEGLFRFDGTEFVRRSDAIVLHYAVAGPGKHVVAGAQDATWIEWDGERIDDLRGADGSPIPEIQNVEFDRDGALWALRRSDAKRRDATGWLDIPLPAGHTGRSMARHPTGGVVCGTREGGILLLEPGAVPKMLRDDLGGVVTHVAVEDDGGIVANVRFGPKWGVVRLEDGVLQRLVEETHRPTGLAVRGTTIWSSWDTGVIAIRPGEAPEYLRPRDGFYGGGNVRVDRERSLWITGFAGGLTHFTEPDTRLYTERSGLDHSLVRQVVRAGDTLWAATWDGLLRYSPQEDRWESVPGDRFRLERLACGLANGDLFTVGIENARPGAPDRGVLLRIRRDGIERLATEPGVVPEITCTPDDDGGQWLVLREDIYRISVRGEARVVGRVPDAVRGVAKVAVGPDGSVWVAGLGDRVCRSDDPSARDWDCVRANGVETAFDLMVVDRDRVWVATDRGLVSCDRASCSPILDPGVLGSNEIVAIVPSKRGGVWVESRTDIVRLVGPWDRPVIIERLSAQQGLPRWWLASLLEDPDGTLWVSGLTGITRVPPDARGDELPPPLVQVTRLTVGGRAREPEAPVRAVTGQDTIELHWAALSFRDPLRLRYRFRLDASLPWVDTRVPRLAFVAPGTGHYRLEVAAALDPAAWNVAPSVIDLEVVPPWYFRWTFLVGIGVALGAIGVAGYRLRVAYLLRLERQRTQIAMDLHDDIGAALGGIGLLAALAGDDEVEPGARRRALDRISAQTGSVASALADIVWSLRPGAETLDQLILALRERAAELVPDGGIEVRFETPDPPPRLRLTLPVRRNVQWIAVEALRNAVRHGSPSLIRVGLGPAGPAWRLFVEDDGLGLADERSPGVRGGMGLENMQRRAAAVRARFEFGPGASGGTRVSLLFRPDGRAP